MTAKGGVLHCFAEELRQMLYETGVPNGALALVETACDLCDVCKCWATSQAKPAAAISMHGDFNERVLMDLVFFSDAVLMMAADEATKPQERLTLFIAPTKTGSRWNNPFVVDGTANTDL